MTTPVPTPVPTDVPTASEVASVSLSAIELNPRDLADRLGQSFVTYGFAIVRDHGISRDLVDRAEAMSRAFFALPEAVKCRYRIDGGGGARGYTPFGIETAKGGKAFDLKEFWHVGRDVPPEHRLSQTMPANVWPSEVDGFRETFAALYAAFDQVGITILRAIARFLGIDERFLIDSVEDGNSVMRLLHYPPQSEPTGAHLRAAAHEDINAITLLLGAQEAGLQLLTRSGTWMDVSPGPDELVVNIGDMLQRLTNGRLRSTSHRVVNPAPERASKARYSMPFFLHFRSDFVIEALPSTVPAGEKPELPPITADDYLQERLREIKLK